MLAGVTRSFAFGVTLAAPVGPIAPLILGSLMVQIIFAAGGATLARLVSKPGWIRALNMLSGAAIAAFGVTALIKHAA